MKFGKLILFLAVAAYHTAGAQGFSLFYQGAKLPPDTLITRAGMTDSLELTTFFTIRNDAATEKQILEKKTEISLAEGAACSLCWAGYCYPPEVNQADYPLILAPGESQTSCFTHFLTGGVAGSSLVRWTFFDTGNPADSVSVVINYITYPAGIGAPPANDRVLVYPNPADNLLCFVLKDPGISGMKIVLRAVTGQKTALECQRVSPGKFCMDTSDLPCGIYVYSVVSHGSPVAGGLVSIVH